MDNEGNNEVTMTNDEYTLTVDMPEPGLLRLVLIDGTGITVMTRDVPYQGHVDNILLTTVDKLITSATLDRSALTTVQIGQGIDKNSSLYRIVQSFATAIAAVSASWRNPAA